jgi:hypothetical protein
VFGVEEIADHTSANSEWGRTTESRKEAKCD